MSANSRKTTFQSSASFAINPALKHISAGWVDQELVTVRKMARDGATADEIGAACGKTRAWAHQYIRRNKLVWNQKSKERHAVLSASAIGAHMTAGHGRWHDRAKEMRLAGASIKSIAAELDVNYATVAAHLTRNDIRAPIKLKPVRETRDRSAAMRASWARRREQGYRPAIKPNAATMLDLIIRLHVEETLSEGQVQEATGLDRVDIRVLREKHEREAA